jgi:hypothetical protein
MDPEEIKTKELKLTKKQLAAELVQNKEEIVGRYIEVAKDDFFYFVRGLIIDGQTGPRVFDSVMCDFQKVTFTDLAESIEAIRNGTMPKVRRAWIERTKKASKDADLATIVAWLVAFPTRPFYGQIGAADRDQAGIIKDRLVALMFHNPWLRKYVRIVGYEIRSTAEAEPGTPLCRFEIKSSHIAGSHGGTPDLLIINELSHITKWEFAENLMDNADGVLQGMAIVATNAGIKGSKSWTWRETAMVSDEWNTYLLSQPAPWHSKAAITDAEMRNSRSRNRRLWWGEWPSGHGDALEEADLVRMFSRMRRPMENPQAGWTYILGLDLGVSKDHAGLAVVAVSEKLKKIEVVNWKRWDPKESKTKKVDLTSVRMWCLDWYKRYRAMMLIYDPHQAALMVQDLQGKGMFCREMTFSSATNLSRMASCLIQVVSNHQIECYDDSEMTLRGDFGKFNIVEKSYGQRLEAVADESGHADVGTAVVVTLPAVVDLMNGMSTWLDNQDDLQAEDSPLTEEEIDDLPGEFKELLESEVAPEEDLDFGEEDLSAYLDID